MYMLYLIALVICLTTTEPILVQTNPSGKPGSTSNVAGNRQARQWRYEQRNNSAGQPVYTASVESVNLVPFDFPYQGGSVVTLTLRKGQQDTFVALEVSKGLFTRSFLGGHARVRFDGAQAVTYTLSAAANGRANIVFIDTAPAFIRKLKTARKMVIRLEFAGQPTREVQFSTQGLRWNH